MSNQFTPLIERIRMETVCGGKMGLPTTIRLLNLVEQMAQEIDRLERRVEYHDRKRMGP